MFEFRPTHYVYTRYMRLDTPLIVLSKHIVITSSNRTPSSLVNRMLEEMASEKHFLIIALLLMVQTGHLAHGQQGNYM